MKIIIFDTEYLSLSKKYSNIKSVIKFKKKLFPEIIQISFLKCSNIFLRNKKKKLNIFIKIKQKIPKRITKLTKITPYTLQKKGYHFEKSMSLIDKFVDKNSILIANGEDITLLKLNMKYNNFIKNKKKSINFVNLKKILNKFGKKNYDTENLNKIFNFKINFNPHYASNDCIIIYKAIRKIIKIYGKKQLKKMILQNKKSIRLL